jgi:hypothetical protein
MKAFEKKRALIRLAAVAAGISAMATVTPAVADSVTVTVNANVAAVCKFFAGSPNPSMTIANSGADIDPSSSTTAQGSVNIDYRCSAGTTPTFSIPSSTLALNGPGGSTMNATITLTPPASPNGTGMGSGNNKTLTVGGSIAAAVFQNKAPGTYTNTVQVTLTP